ncbi:Protein F59F5.5 [Aphelenchoides avenae]|nr:Protein F59F5.5 [Aphelenchus avenae]
MVMNVFLLFVACASLGFCIATASECHSCMSFCKTLPSGKLDPERCDCVGNETCSGDYCFAKVETFPEEYTAIIQKGCVKNLPTGVEGCQFAGQAESLDFYTPKPLPTVECCECSEPRGEKCPKDTCLRKCRGNYCLVDFEGVEQGCGLGLPRLQNFLRVYNFSDMTGDTTCARYQATSSTIVHGCVCTKPTGMCNELNKSREYQLEKVVKRRLDDQNYCYSLHQKSKRSFDKDVFKK